MGFVERLALVVIVYLAYGAQYNAAEAHRHTHELGCALEYEPLCKWSHQ